jgi:hypothetical protein
LKPFLRLELKNLLKKDGKRRNMFMFDHCQYRKWWTTTTTLWIESILLTNSGQGLPPRYSPHIHGCYCFITYSILQYVMHIYCLSTTVNLQVLSTFVEHTVLFEKLLWMNFLDSTKLHLRGSIKMGKPCHLVGWTAQRLSTKSKRQLIVDSAIFAASRSSGRIKVRNSLESLREWDIIRISGRPRQCASIVRCFCVRNASLCSMISKFFGK